MRVLAFLLLFPGALAAQTAADTVEVWEVMATNEVSAREAYELAWASGAPVVRFSHPSPGGGSYTYTFDRLTLLGGGVDRTVLVDSAVVVTVADYTGTAPETEFGAGQARGLLSFTGADGLVVDVRGTIDANARPGHLPLSPEGTGWDDRTQRGTDTSLRSHHAIEILSSHDVLVRGGTLTNAWFGVSVTYSTDVTVEDVRLVPGPDDAAGPRRQSVGGWIGGYLNAALAMRGVENGVARRIAAEGSSETVDLNDVGFPVTLDHIEGIEVWEAVLEVSGAPDYTATDVRGINSATVLNLRPYTGNVARGTVTGVLARYTPDAPGWLEGRTTVPLKVHSEATVTGARVEIGPGPSPVRQILHQAIIEGRRVLPHVGRVEVEAEVDPTATFADGVDLWGAGEHEEVFTHYGGDLSIRWRGPVPQGRRLVWSYGAGRVDIESAENTAASTGTLIGVGTLHAGGLAVGVASATGFAREVETATASEVSGVVSTEGEYVPHAAAPMALAVYGDALLAADDGQPVDVWRNRGSLSFELLGGGTPDGAAPVVREGVGLEFGPGSSLDWGTLHPDSFDVASHRVTLRFRATDLGTRQRRLYGFGGLAPYRVMVAREGVSVRTANDPPLTLDLPPDPARWYVLTVEVAGTALRMRLAAEGEAPVGAEQTLSQPFPDDTGRFLVGGGREGSEAPGTLWISHFLAATGTSAEITQSLGDDEALMHVLRGYAPALSSPETDAEVRLPVCLDWEPVPGALAYRLDVDGVVKIQTDATLACLDDELTPGQVYTWRVQAFSPGGASPATGPRSFSVRTDPPPPQEPPGEEPGETPEGEFVTAVGRPAPNPTRGPASLLLSLAQPEIVRVDAFDARGRRLATLHQDGLERGLHTLPLAFGGLPPGVYALVVRIGARPPVTRLYTRL